MSVPADSPRTPAEHAEVVTKAMWAKQPPRNGSLERDHDDYDWTMQQGKESLAALVALADRYREALRKFGRHDFGCPAGRGERNERGKCNCGLSAVLAAGAGDE